MKEITRTAEDFRVLFTGKIDPIDQITEKMRESLCDVFTLAAADFSARMIRENINEIKMDFENFCFFFEFVFDRFGEIHCDKYGKNVHREEFTKYLRDQHWPLLMEHDSYRISEKAYEKLKSELEHRNHKIFNPNPIPTPSKVKI
jgi:hypothetical protein